MRRCPTRSSSPAAARHPWQRRHSETRSPASHGCIRLSRDNAATLFDLVSQEGLLNTKVVVKGEEAIVTARNSATTAGSLGHGNASLRRPVRRRLRATLLSAVLLSGHGGAASSASGVIGASALFLT